MMELLGRMPRKVCLSSWLVFTICILLQTVLLYYDIYLFDPVETVWHVIEFGSLEWILLQSQF
jgi:hypothetical protein